MEEPTLFRLNYSLKNIPVPSQKAYLSRLIEKVESLLKRMRWKAFFYLKGDDGEEYSSNNHGFRTRKCPPAPMEMKAFEEDMVKLIESVSFRRVTDPFQNQMKEDIHRIRQSDKMLVEADKTRNIYSVDKEQYQKIIDNNVTSKYKIAPAETYDVINEEAKKIASTLGIADRVETMARKPAYVTLKDHKTNFKDKLPCRLIFGIKIPPNPRSGK